MHDIVCHGQDGSVLTYHAIRDEALPPEQIGWVLVIEGGSQEVAPQAVGAEDVLGDLVSMEIDLEEAQGLVRMFTEQMRDLAVRRAEETAGSEIDPDGWRRRADELEQELELVNRGTAFP